MFGRRLLATADAHSLTCIREEARATASLIKDIGVIPKIGHTFSVMLQTNGEKQMLFDEGFTFRNFLVDAFSIFMFMLWFWLLIIVFAICSDAVTYLL